MNGGGV